MWTSISPNYFKITETENLLEPIYDEIIKINDNYFIIRQNNLYGLVYAEVTELNYIFNLEKQEILYYGNNIFLLKKNSDYYIYYVKRNEKFLYNKENEVINFNNYFFYKYSNIEFNTNIWVLECNKNIKIYINLFKDDKSDCYIGIKPDNTIWYINVINNKIIEKRKL